MTRPINITWYYRRSHGNSNGLQVSWQQRRPSEQMRAQVILVGGFSWLQHWPILGQFFALLRI